VYAKFRGAALRIKVLGRHFYRNDSKNKKRKKNNNNESSVWGPAFRVQKTTQFMDKKAVLSQGNRAMLQLFFLA